MELYHRLAIERDSFNAGLEAAAEHLRAKASKMRHQPNPSLTADMMARIYDDEALAILGLWRMPQ